MKYGDKIRAIPGTVDHMFSEGRIGVIAEVRDPKGYSGNNSNNLVRWGDETILTGFHPDQVEVVNDE